ncbi:hypothetical protein [Streptomyces sp. NPDC058294]|uniref:hypothetical protein n=1 Tax=Streptomyces sp. NPDC058294 TaxID=3346430 RepID=UPI0036E8A2D3
MPTTFDDDWSDEAFARDVGALPMWVRFGSGSIEKIDGMSVLDFRDAVRAVRAAGDGGGAP